jgi:hypothetical protein
MDHKNYELHIVTNYVIETPPASEWPSELTPYTKGRLYGNNNERHHKESSQIAEAL